MNIKQKLGLGALVLGMSGCSGYNSSYGDPVAAELPQERNLSTDEIEPRADEKYVVDTDFGYCLQADVVMNADVYHIDCNTNFHLKKTFVHHHGGRNTDILDWGTVVYMEDGSDGVLDRVYANGIAIEKISQEQNNLYNLIVKKFNKDLVHQIWLERWHPDLLQ